MSFLVTLLALTLGSIAALFFIINFYPLKRKGAKFKSPIKIPRAEIQDDKWGIRGEVHGVRITNNDSNDREALIEAKVGFKDTLLIPVKESQLMPIKPLQALSGAMGRPRWRVAYNSNSKATTEELKIQDILQRMQLDRDSYKDRYLKLQNDFYYYQDKMSKYVRELSQASKPSPPKY